MKIVLNLCLFLTLSSFAYSQTWIDNDAIWHYNVDAGGLFQGYSKYEYTQDSLILGHNCQMIEMNQHRVTDYNNVYGHSNNQMETNFTYVSGDTVFWLIDNTFKVLYNFGAQVGDTWVIADAHSEFECLQAIVEVDSIGTILMNGQNLRWISFHSLDNSSYLYSGKAVERFGLFEMDYYSPHGLFPVQADCTEGTIVDYFFNKFTCYEDASFNLFNSSSNDCEYLASLSLEDLNETNALVTIYVDQSSKELHLQSKENLNTSCKIVNNMGQNVIAEMPLFISSETETIDLSTLIPGIYYIQLHSDKTNQMMKIILSN